MAINLNGFERKLDIGQQKLAWLNQQLAQKHPSIELLKGLEDFSNALEEIYVLSEELMAQHSQLQMAQNTLGTEQQKYFELFNLAPDGYIVTNRQGLIQQINLTAANLINRRQQFLMGKPLIMLLTQTERQRFYNLLSALRQGNAQQTIHLQLQPYQARPFDASFTVAAVYDHQDQIVGFRWLFRDLTAQQRSALRDSEHRYVNLAAAVPVGIFRTDTSGQFTYVNPCFCQLSGLTSQFALQHGWLQGLHPDDRRQVTAEWAQSTSQNQPFQLEFRFQHADDTVKWVYGQAVPESDANGVTLGYIGSITDITDHKQTQAQIEHSALHDALTNLPNRTLLLERLEFNISKARRDRDYGYAVLFLDLDRFKVVNDSLGHAVGDKLLVALAQGLKKHLRNIDLVSRLGGDEFVILLENTQDPAAVVHIVERILADCQTPFVINGHEIFVSLSIGIVLGSQEYHHAADVMRDADIAMYQSKTNAHSAYTFFNQVMHSQLRSRLALEVDLRQALEQQEFTLYYQPIFELRSHRLVGFEALSRWRHPARGMLSPDEFIPMAEAMGLIVSLDRWVWHQACGQIAIWRQTFGHACDLKVSINLSGKDLSRRDLIETIDQTLTETALTGDAIILEIPESSLLEDIDQTIHVLTQLASRGIQISINDFGTGYSSLSYLHRLPVHILKIDHTFTKQIETDNNRQIVNTILTLANQLGLNVVAEGIETERQQKRLQQLGCQWGQGYLFSSPLAAADVEATFLKG